MGMAGYGLDGHTQIEEAARAMWRPAYLKAEVNTFKRSLP